MLAYILLNFDPGKEREHFDTLSQLPEVKRIHMVYGEWDFILLTDTASPGALEEFIVDNLRQLDGIKLTSTMIVAK